jgi:molybdopterin-guanine dinucleotide biosynthesis protein A
MKIIASPSRLVDKITSPLCWTSTGISITASGSVQCTSSRSPTDNTFIALRVINAGNGHFNPVRSILVADIAQVRFVQLRYIRSPSNVICSGMTMRDNLPTTPGLLLAGGLARRMGGGDKPMRTIGGRSLLDRVITRLAPQCDGLVLNANGDPARFAPFGLPVIADDIEDYPGPLAGILAGLDWIAANRPDVTWMLSAAGDCPFLPRDLVTRLHEARIAEGAQLAVAASAGQSHPVIGLWDVALRHELRHALVYESVRAVCRWTARYRLATVAWPVAPVDPFFNANTMDDIAEAERLALLDDKA